MSSISKFSIWPSQYWFEKGSVFDSTDIFYEPLDSRLCQIDIESVEGVAERAACKCRWAGGRHTRARTVTMKNAKATHLYKNET